MAGDPTENNVATVSGIVATQLRFSHEIYGEGFYYFLLDVPRLSESHDSIAVTISERLIGKRRPDVGVGVSIEGQFRSYNSVGESHSRLLLTVFARELAFVDEGASMKNPNSLYLNGYICKKPVYRSTPFGREITDLLIAVNRAYGKSDYIPCISWGRNARFCANLNVGDNIKVWGRIQSRTYQKKSLDGSVVNKVAYEVSLSKLETADARRQDGRQESDGFCQGQGADGQEPTGLRAAHAGPRAPVGDKPEMLPAMGAAGMAGAAGIAGGAGIADGVGMASGASGAGAVCAAGAAGGAGGVASEELEPNGGEGDEGLAQNGGEGAAGQAAASVAAYAQNAL